MSGAIFAAVPPTVETRLAVAEAISDLAIPGRLAPPENWHLTLRYLGRIDEVTYERFLHGLVEVGSQPAFGVSLGEIGAFPNARRATVVWVGVEDGGDALARLAETADEAAVAAGLDSEERPFRPHLTLARVRPPADVTGLVGMTVKARWLADRVVVYRSVAGGRGARYEPLETFRLRV